MKTKHKAWAVGVPGDLLRRQGQLYQRIFAIEKAETHTMNRRTRTNIADYGLFVCLLITVPIAWASVAAFFLLIDWVAG